jgi:hypothetical protein
LLLGRRVSLIIRVRRRVKHFAKKVNESFL